MTQNFVLNFREGNLSIHLRRVQCLYGALDILQCMQVFSLFLFLFLSFRIYVGKQRVSSFRWNRFIVRLPCTGVYDIAAPNRMELCAFDELKLFVGFLQEVALKRHRTEARRLKNYKNFSLSKETNVEEAECGMNRNLISGILLQKTGYLKYIVNKQMLIIWGGENTKFIKMRSTQESNLREISKSEKNLLFLMSFDTLNNK